ncbi:MAG: 4Fe-4S cluster-binding domain-containing protein [Bacteroidetes bacterium]|jgi:L-lysine 2,3-aminomutase|nr:4Fe-4S cluster-binding domain-containing protein [Bacteroidota bacterium]
MRFITYNTKNFRKIEYIRYLPEEVKREIDIVSRVIPFKTNNYVVDHLIDWENYLDDPIYILNFPNKNMLHPEAYQKVKHAVENNLPTKKLTEIITEVRMAMNPHPANQVSNVPHLNGRELTGMQHKYRDVTLFFPSQGQTCHAHCTFCFRWPQFTKELDLKFAMREIDQVAEYIRQHPEINEILFTGGDPMIMNPRTISKYIDYLIESKIPNLKTIRFGTKSLAYWPFTFIPEYNEEAGEMLAMFRRIVDSGYHLAFMAHFNHYNELGNAILSQAVQNILETGATIRTQAPVLNHINNDSEVWARMWKDQIGLGMIPYYMFIERETGPYDYFSVPLAEVYRMYQQAAIHTGSFAKTVTGPVMSAAKGKVQILGIIDNPVNGQKYFMMQYVRHRDFTKTFQPFFMHFDKQATWVDQLEEVVPQEVMAI